MKEVLAVADLEADLRTCAMSKQGWLLIVVECRSEVDKGSTEAELECESIVQAHAFVTSQRYNRTSQLARLQSFQVGRVVAYSKARSTCTSQNNSLGIAKFTWLTRPAITGIVKMMIAQFYALLGCLSQSSFLSLLMVRI